MSLNIKLPAVVPAQRRCVLSTRRRITILSVPRAADPRATGARAAVCLFNSHLSPQTLFNHRARSSPYLSLWIYTIIIIIISFAAVSPSVNSTATTMKRINSRNNHPIRGLIVFIYCDIHIFTADDDLKPHDLHIFTVQNANEERPEDFKDNKNNKKKKKMFFSFTLYCIIFLWIYTLPFSRRTVMHRS